MTAWTEKDVHEALLRWGSIAARMDDGGLGYPAASLGLAEMRMRPYRALEPTEFASCEFHQLEAAIGRLVEPLKVVVLCYYKPGHLRACWHDSGPDGKGRQRSPSIRAIAVFLLVGKHVIEARLKSARSAIARELTRCENSDRIAAVR